MKTFLLRWKRRLQRRFPLAGFPDPGKHQPLPAGPLLSGSFGWKTGEAPFQGVNLSRLCCLPFFWQFRERLSTWWRKRYSLITNVPRTRRPDAPSSEKAGWLPRGMRPRPPARSPKRGKMRTLYPQPLPDRSPCTAVALEQDLEKQPGNLNSAGRPLLPAPPLL